MERKGGRKSEGGVSERHEGEPICLMGHQKGREGEREGGRERDHADDKTWM